MEISFCSHPNIKKVGWAVVACAKFCRDIIISNWIRAKWNLHRIWIVMEKSLVKWVSVAVALQHLQLFGCSTPPVLLNGSKQYFSSLLHHLPDWWLVTVTSKLLNDWAVHVMHDIDLMDWWPYCCTYMGWDCSIGLEMVTIGLAVVELQCTQEFGCSIRIPGLMGPMTMPLHLYRPWWSHRTSDGVDHLSSCGVTATTKLWQMDGQMDGRMEGDYF